MQKYTARNGCMNNKVSGVMEAVVSGIRALVTWVSDLKCMNNNKSNEIPLFQFFRCVLYSQHILNILHSPLKKNAA
jgi:hypothetical protein